MVRTSRLSPALRVTLGVVIVCLVVAAGVFGYHRSPKVGASSGTGLPPVVTAVLPAYESCGQAPQFEPRLVEACGSPCGMAIGSIFWSVWTTTIAQGTGVTVPSPDIGNAHCPRRGAGRTVTFVLSDPQLESFCSLNRARIYTVHSQIVFLSTNVPPGIQLPPPECGSTGPSR